MNELKLRADAEFARRELLRRQARSHPAYLLHHVSMPDERTASDFRFQLLDPCDRYPAHEEHEGCCWYWQRHLLNDWTVSQRHLTLKARQLGVTWLAGGLMLWEALYMPGTRHIIYRQKEADAGEIVERIWDMFQSLPTWLWNGARVVTPAKGHRPSTMIELVFPDGRMSTIQGMASTSSAGHGKTVRRVLMDEASRIDQMGELMKAVQPAAGAKGFINIVSTANGVADDEGNGNYFAYLWKGSDAGFKAKFLGWYCHPDRDDEWYLNDPEIRGLRAHERAEQYPSNPNEAFTLSNKVFFDDEALAWYGENAVEEPLFRFDFKPRGPNRARFLKSPEGRIAVFRRPVEGHTYGIGADVATGRGRDYSAAHVIDLATMEFVAEFHGRLPADVFAYQLHFLGRWYHNAVLAVEMGGGFGEPVVLNLRDGKDGRPPYPRLYRYMEEDRPLSKVREAYGYPMTTKSRPLVINGIEKALREHSLPFLSSPTLFEYQTFVHHDTNPSPRAQTGTNDDLVFSSGIALEVYRRYGAHPDARKSRRLKRPKTAYPWQEERRGKRRKAPEGWDPPFRERHLYQQ